MKGYRPGRRGPLAPPVTCEDSTRRHEPEVEGTSRPVSRVLSSPRAVTDGHPSGTTVAGGLVRSTRRHRAGRPRAPAQDPEGVPLDLAPGGVCRAARVTPGAGGLLPHRFTLAGAAPGGAVPAVCSLWHFPAGHPGSVLPTTLPCGARTFLDGVSPAATVRPTRPASSLRRLRQPQGRGSQLRGRSAVARSTGCPPPRVRGRPRALSCASTTARARATRGPPRRPPDLRLLPR